MKIARLIILGLLALASSLALRSHLELRQTEEARAQIISGLLREVAWKEAYIRAIQEATREMELCTVEQYATRHSGGPICQRACREYAALIPMLKNRPSFVHLGPSAAEPVPQPDPAICKEDAMSSSGLGPGPH